MKICRGGEGGDLFYVLYTQNRAGRSRNLLFPFFTLQIHCFGLNQRIISSINQRSRVESKVES